MRVRVHISQSKHQEALLKYKWNKIVYIFIGKDKMKVEMRVHNSQSNHQETLLKYK
jgi:hypothetical protein